MTDILLVISKLPDQKSAQRLAEKLVEERLAACVSVLAPCASVYRWQGRTETAAEYPVFIKTRISLYPQVERAIRKEHPYELPEIIGVPLSAGLPEYLEWVIAETRDPGQ